MDPIASEAMAALVQVMATDAWQQTRTAFVDLWQRRHPREASHIQVELDALSMEMVDARQTGQASAAQGLVRLQRSRLHQALLNDPDLAAELHRLVHEVLEPAPAPSQSSGITMIGNARDNSTINQIVGNQTNHRS